VSSASSKLPTEAVLEYPTQVTEQSACGFDLDCKAIEFEFSVP